MSAIPFKVEKSDKAVWFDRYYFHCIDCGEVFMSHRCDSRTSPYCCVCHNKHIKERAKILAKEREEKKIAEIRAKTIEEMKQKFRAEFEEQMSLGLEDCINWADWFDVIAEDMKEGAEHE